MARRTRRVLVVHRDPLFPEVVTHLLRDDASVRLRTSCATDREALDALRRFRPQVVIVQKEGLGQVLAWPGDVWEGVETVIRLSFGEPGMGVMHGRWVPDPHPEDLGRAIRRRGSAVRTRGGRGGGTKGPGQGRAGTAERGQAAPGAGVSSVARGDCLGSAGVAGWGASGQ